MFNANAQFMFFGRDVGATVFCLSYPPLYLPSREIEEVCREGEPARIFWGKCQGLGKEGKDMKGGVCLCVCHFCFFVFMQNQMFGLVLSCLVFVLSCCVLSCLVLFSRAIFFNLLTHSLASCMLIEQTKTRSKHEQQITKLTHTYREKEVFPFLS